MERADMIEQEKVRIGISWMQDDIDVEKYGIDPVACCIDMIKKAQAEPVPLMFVEDETQAGEELDKIDALVMTGGRDVAPSIYGEEPFKTLVNFERDRDKSDMLLLKAAIERDIPVMATCRGLQVLNVLNGGTLYQDISAQYKTDILHISSDEVNLVSHPIKIEEGSLIKDIIGKTESVTNSWHHQCVKDLGEGLKVTARSADGIVEAVELEGASFIMAVQFHPEVEEGGQTAEYIKFFERLVKEASGNAKMSGIDEK